MGIFMEAVRRGMDAGRRAAEARAAIDRTLAAASRDVSAVVGTDIALRWLLTTSGIVAGTGANREVLATVEVSDVGFPLTLRWDDRVERVNDAAVFETAMLRLLESASIAEAILRVARRKGEGG